MTRLKEFRLAAGLSQQDLAVRAGLSLSAIAGIENGRVPTPRLDTCRAIAAALSAALCRTITTDDIWPTTPDETERAAVR